MSLSEEERLKLRLLGLLEDDAADPQTAGAADSANDEAARRAMLERRRKYLELRKTQQVVPKTITRKSVLGRFSLLGVLILAVFSGVWITSAKAHQDRAHLTYARKLLGGMTDLYCDDLVVLNHVANRAEAMLPDAPMMVLGTSEWQQLYASSRAARCLFSARLGQIDAAVEQFNSATKFAKGVTVGQNSEIALLYELCIGKAGHTLAEALTDMNQRQRATDLFETALHSLENAYQLANSCDYLSADESNLICAGVLLDLARLRMKTAPPAELIDNLPATDAFVRQAFQTAKTHLQRIDYRDASWWAQLIRCKGYETLLEGRRVYHLPQPSDFYKTAVDDLQSFLASIPSWRASQLSQQDRNHISTELAILISNVSDMIELSASTKQCAELEVELLDLRKQTFDLLGSVPPNSRTLRLLTNASINLARRMNLRCRLAGFSDKLETDWPAILQDALALEALLGNVLDADTPQLRPQNRLLAAMILGYETKDGKFREIWTQFENWQQLNEVGDESDVTTLKNVAAYTKTEL